MYLNFSVLTTAFRVVLVFVVFRIVGKYIGTALGASIGGASEEIRKYTIGGLVPQGGIVIGLALMLKQDHAFDNFSDIVITIWNACSYAVVFSP